MWGNAKNGGWSPTASEECAKDPNLRELLLPSLLMGDSDSGGDSCTVQDQLR